jgi:hypothetical protein
MRTAELTLANRHLRQEINERRYMQDRLNYLATHDFVTRLYNRGALDAHCLGAARGIQRGETEAVFLLIDIDQFRLVNETCGIVAGDELLRQFSELVAAQLDRTISSPARGRQVRRRRERPRRRGRPALARRILAQLAAFTSTGRSALSGWPPPSPSCASAARSSRSTS